MIPSTHHKQSQVATAVAKQTPDTSASRSAISRQLRTVTSQAAGLQLADACDRKKLARYTQAAVRIQRGWRHWRASIAALKASAAPGQRFVSTSYMPRSASADGKNRLVPSQTLGMLNFTPVDGSGPVLSAYMTRDNPGALGHGRYSEVDVGPRGYISRYPVGEYRPSFRIDRAAYADLTSFVGVDQVTEQLQIGRYAGLNIHRMMFRKSYVIPVHMFQRASSDLMKAHMRGLCHNDIKADNMAGRMVAGKPVISFIDCDRLAAEGLKFLPTFNRLHIEPEKHDPGDRDFIAHDEYAFLRILMTASDPASYDSCMPENRDSFTPSELKTVRRHCQIFVDRYIKPEYKKEVGRFLHLPVLNNCLSKPLHLMIDWEPKFDLIACMNLGNARTLKKWGAVLLHKCKTPAERQELLYAANVDNVPGLYFARFHEETHKAWQELAWTLPKVEQIQLRDRLFDCSVSYIEAGLTKRMWFFNSMLPIREAK